MSEMVERVAVAMVGEPLSKLHPFDRERWLESARAAIKAMLEPTDAMLEQCDQYGEGCYRAMIDAAFADAGEKQP